MRIAIVGAGVSGLVTARLLHSAHDVTVFDGHEHAGGHAHTVDVERAGASHAVDTGFVVYNETTYPLFSKLLRKMQVQSQPAEMSFSVRCSASGFEYASRGLAGLLARPRNAVSPGFYRMLRDVVRFNREARRLLREPAEGPSVAEFLASRRYSAEFRDHYLVPMASALWSARTQAIHQLPARTLVEYFAHQEFLRIWGQLQWRSITGGSRTYVDALVAPFRDRIRLRTPIASIRRHAHHVDVTPHGGPTERFDHVVLALNGRLALRLLADPTPAEERVLSAFDCQENDGLLHVDESVLPASRAAWSSWNAHLQKAPDRVAVTYDMTRLQRLPSVERICLTLNHAAEVDPKKVLLKLAYTHPVYTPAAVRAQRRHEEISGTDRTHYCGAYWGHGFHEDGVESAVRACRTFGVVL